MHENLAKLYCPNPTCQAVNSERDEFCQTCRTPLPKRYLWAIVLRDSDDSSLGGTQDCLDRAWDGLDFGSLWCDRYWLKGDRVVLDTRPGDFPDLPEVVPPALEAYLRLFPYRWHVPQIYGRAGAPSRLKGRSIWLLEEAPIREVHGAWTLQPSLDESWAKAPPLRQLNWLWQIAQLWEPLCREGVAESLLNLQQICVEGGRVRLPQLTADVKPPTFSRLGNIWTRLVSRTEAPLRGYLERLCDRLGDGSIQTPLQLSTALDRALDLAARSVTYHHQVATLTDRGPSRARNEDACYPPSGDAKRSDHHPLTLVCDGVGGHEGGDIASRLAIDTVREHLQPIQRREGDGTRDREAFGNRNRLIHDIEHAIAKANDAICARNNQEQRQGRRRMGTTLVMLLARGRDVYITHIGDSRAYLVAGNQYYPVTIDDDVASRDVRLGYSFYREALERPAAGSLVQALGMGPSHNLHPTTTRFTLDDDCLFLLCSDGLSDYDRVEQVWQQELLPLIGKRDDLKTAARRLVDIANDRNGHDNVTVSLLRVRVEPKPNARLSRDALLACLEDLPKSPQQEDTADWTAAADDSSDSSDPTELSPAPEPSSPGRWLRMGAIAALLAGIVGGVAYYGWAIVRDRDRADHSLPNVLPAPSDSTLGDPAAPEPGEPPYPEAGTVLRLNAPLELYARAGSDEPPRTTPTEGVPFRVENVTRSEENASYWLQLTPCTPSLNGRGGWVELETLREAGFRRSQDACAGES